MTDLTATEIVREVAAANSIRVTDIFGSSRWRTISWPRQEVMWRLRREKRWSYQQIANFLQLQNHTSVIYGVAAHQRRYVAAKALPVRTPDDPFGYSTCL